jgi:hypothetical protein
MLVGAGSGVVLGPNGADPVRSPDGLILWTDQAGRAVVDDLDRARGPLRDVGVVLHEVGDHAVVVGLGRLIRRRVVVQVRDRAIRVGAVLLRGVDLAGARPRTVRQQAEETAAQGRRTRGSTGWGRGRRRRPDTRPDLRLLGCGQGRGRTADLPLFRRTLVPTELPAQAGETLQQRSRRAEFRRRTGLATAGGRHMLVPCIHPHRRRPDCGPTRHEPPRRR